MEFTLQELNEIYYCLGKTLQATGINFANKDLVNQIADKVRNEIERQAMGNDEDYKAALQLQQDEHKHSLLTSPSYREWWEQNKERILAEDKLNHDMQFKSAYAKQGDY
jgi:hypothetical protein